MTYLSYGVHWHNNDTLLCFIAGLSLGVLVTTRMYIFGKVTGISGILSGKIIVIIINIICSLPTANSIFHSLLAL